MAGPGGAVAATLRRLGWQADGALCWITHEGRRISLEEVAPRTEEEFIWLIPVFFVKFTKYGNVGIEISALWLSTLRVFRATMGLSQCFSPI